MLASLDWALIGVCFVAIVAIVWWSAGKQQTSTDYFLGRETVRSTQHPGMARWREVLYTVMTRNASDVGAFFHLPPERVVEIGVRVEI